MTIVTAKDIAHDLKRDNPHMGNKSDLEHMVKEMFKIILEHAAKGNKVQIRGFGTFSTSIFKGRTLKSPLMKGGVIDFKDQLVLRFRQSQSAKIAANEIAAKAPEEKAPEEHEGKAAKKAAPKKATAKKKSKKNGVSKAAKAAAEATPASALAG